MVGHTFYSTPPEARKKKEVMHTLRPMRVPRIVPYVCDRFYTTQFGVWIVPFIRLAAVISAQIVSREEPRAAQAPRTLPRPPSALTNAS